jgi:hypothetical protein
MLKLHDFLVEHAKFPFPALHECLSSSTTDISTLDVDFLETEWKAKLAVRDNTLVQKLCDALEGILGDAPLAEGAEDYLLGSFSPRIQFDERGGEDGDWSTNSSEAHVSFFGCSLFETEQFRADPAAESDVATQGVLCRCKATFLDIRSVYLYGYRTFGQKRGFQLEG